MTHVPVLLSETLEYLNVSKGQRFVDGTVGNGGHALAIIQKQPQAEILGIDLDQTSLDKLREKFAQEGLSQKIKLVQGSFAHIDKITAETGFERADGILVDLGFSSDQVDDPARGFSFQVEGPLDMRFDRNRDLTAEKIVNQYPPKDLEAIFLDFGEERLARKIVQSIVSRRKIKPLKTTLELAEAVRTAIPAPIRFKANDNIRRVFQAIRIEVNGELKNLEEFLPKALKILNPKGRLVIISFHSLEDRMVKEFFNREAKDCVCPPEFPTCICNKTSSLRILTRKPITASENELLENSRSKPAKLRAAEKIT